MEFSVLDYAAIDLTIAVLTHKFIRHIDVATGTGMCLCTMASFLMVEVESKFQVKPGWAMPVLLVGFVFALPFCFGTGWVFNAIRKARQSQV